MCPPLRDSLPFPNPPPPLHPQSLSPRSSSPSVSLPALIPRQINASLSSRRFTNQADALVREDRSRAEARTIRNSNENRPLNPTPISLFRPTCPVSRARLPFRPTLLNAPSTQLVDFSQSSPCFRWIRTTRVEHVFRRLSPSDKFSKFFTSFFFHGFFFFFFFEQLSLLDSGYE